MRVFICATVLVTSLSISTSIADSRSSKPLVENPNLIEKYWENFRNYYQCAHWAETRALSGADIEYCVGQYNLVKLSFIEGVNIEDFVDLDVHDRAKVNAEAFRKFKLWEGNHRKVVEQLKNSAKLIQN